MTEEGKVVSIKQRLLNTAKLHQEDFDQVLTRYAGLRFLARLAASEYADRFLLKGATLFLIWHGSMHRPTRDIDLLGFFEADEIVLDEIVRKVCRQEVEDDGLQFQPESVTVNRIRDDTAYGGLRCQIRATLGTARMRVQIDVGFGDDVTPTPQLVELPRLVETEVRRELRAYTPETVVAEKFEAIVKLGLANSRMKDYLDIDRLFALGEVDHERLGMALVRTFRRRSTALPAVTPMGLTEVFYDDELTLRRWHSFVRKNRLDVDSLAEICQRIELQMSHSLALANQRSGGLTDQ